MRLLRRGGVKKLESEFTPRCNAWTGEDCNQPACWAAWSAHASGHEEWFCYCCDKCKKIAEDRWHKYTGKRCICGYRVEGTIDQHLRFIRL